MTWLGKSGSHGSLARGVHVAAWLVWYPPGCGADPWLHCLASQSWEGAGAAWRGSGCQPWLPRCLEQRMGG